VKLDEVGGDVMAGGAGVVGLDEHVVERERWEVGRDGWRDVVHAGEATGGELAGSAIRSGRRRRRVAEVLGDAYRGPV
jgi:hypothetical protein